MSQIVTNKKEKKSFHLFQLILTLMLFSGILAFAAPIEAKADNASPVAVKSIDYNELEMKIELNGNEKVYYSDSTEKTWNEVEGNSNNGFIYLDISWVVDTADYTMTLKGSDDETVVSVVLPAKNKSLTVKFNQLTGELDFTNDEGAYNFEWRKSTSYNWREPIDIAQSSSAAQSFLEEIEAMRVSGAKIYVRVPQTAGTSASDVGSRPSKEVLVTIAKRSSAPKVTVNVTKLTLSTSESMEYKVLSVGGVPTSNTKWSSASKSMTIDEIAPSSAISGSVLTKDLALVFRTAETDKKSYSKEYYLNIPAQDSAPTEIIEGYTSSKYSLTFADASKTNQYQYAIVKDNAIFDENTASWKTVTSNKPVSFTERTAPAGSKIYIRYKGISETSKTSLKLPSRYTVRTVKFGTQ